jgi:hypothetical protein
MAALACSALSAPAAEAQPAPVRLVWVRGAGADACATQQQIAEQVTLRLGRSPFAAGAERAIDAYVTRAAGTAGGWRAEIVVRGGDGQLLGARELTSEADDCTSIASASVLAIALVIDPDAGTRPPPPPAPPPAPAVPAVPAVPPTAPLALVPVAPSPPPVLVPPAPLPAAPSPAVGSGDIGVALGGGAALGLLPRPAPAFVLSARVGLAPSVELTGEALYLPEVPAADPRFAFGLSAFALGACVRVVRRASADLGACGALWAGALHAVVSGLTPVDPGDHVWAAAAASPRLRIRLAPRLDLDLGAHLLVPLVRHPFTVTGWKDPVFQQTPVALLPFAALGTRFP